MKRKIGHKTSAFEKFAHQASSSYHYQNPTSEFVHQLFADSKTQMEALESLLAEAHLARIDGKPKKAIGFAKRAAAKNSPVRDDARLLLLSLDERVTERPKGLYDEDGKFNYEVAAANMNRVHSGLSTGESKTADFYQAFEDAYPEGFWETYCAVKSRTSSEFAPLIEFLEQDPYFFRTGYLKAEVLRILKQRADELSASDRARLQEVVLRTLARRPRHEFPWYLKLARKLLDEEFVTRVAALPGGDGFVSYLQG